MDAEQLDAERLDAAPRQQDQALRWTRQLKALVVHRVAAGELTRAAAQARYGISDLEWRQWQALDPAARRQPPPNGAARGFPPAIAAAEQALLAALIAGASGDNDGFLLDCLFDEISCQLRQSRAAAVVSQARAAALLPEEQSP